jgi:hypothetical protein
MARPKISAVLLLLIVMAFPLTASPAALEPGVPTDPHDRVAHHLRAVDELSTHFEGVVAADCPRFQTPLQWNRYVDGEIERMTLLVAHLEEAWLEAKQTKDKELRRQAKAPRRRVDGARTLLEKLERCADDNGATLDPFGVWRRIEREVPRRQADIALPR